MKELADFFSRSTLIQDLQYAARALRRQPALALASVLSLAIGIGANTVVFGVIYALLGRPLTYADANRLVILWNRSPGLNIAEDWFSTAQFFDIKTGYSGFEALSLAIGANSNLTGAEDPERVGVIRTSSNLLTMLGARAAAGRLFVDDDDRPGQPGTAVLSHGIWTRRYGGDARAVGQSLTLNGQSYRIVGVLPAGFSLPREVLPTLGVVENGDIFLPLPLGPAAATTRDREDYNIVGKLKPGVRIAEAQAAMDALTARLRREHPDVYPANGGLTFSIVPLLDQIVGGVRRPLAVLMGAVGFVLLIACANVASLQLARAVARRRELAVRAALGAGRARLARQLLTESLLLSCAGGLGGLVLAAAGVAWIRALHPQDIPRLASIGLDVPVLVFTMAVSAAAGVLVGLAPMLGVSRLDVHATLTDASRGSTARALWGRGQPLRKLLVVAELALSVVLLVGAGLLIRSFAAVQRVPPGLNPNHVLTFEVAMNGRKYADGPTVVQTYRDLWSRLEALPGVTGAGGVTTLPLSQFFAWGPITVEGRILPPGERFINADQRTVSGRYFQAMDVPLLRGRLFDDRDVAGGQRVVVIDERMAQDLWLGDDPIGKRIHFGDAAATAPWETVIGVVGAVKQYGLDADARIAFYRPQAQSPARSLYVALRSDADLSALAPRVRQVVREIDPDLPVSHVMTMAARVDESLARRRFSMTLLAIFAGVALMLATVGIYGVMAYLVDQGRREVGIRIALGATTRAILRLVLGQGLVLAAAGVAAGLVGALALTRLLQSLLFGVGAADPLTFAAMAALLAATAIVASYVPARRAARTDPIVALRSE